MKLRCVLVGIMTVLSATNLRHFHQLCWPGVLSRGSSCQLPHLSTGMLSCCSRIIRMNLRFNDSAHFQHDLMQMLHGKANPKHVLDEEDRDVLIMQMPDDQAYYEEWQIDDNVVHNFVDELKPESTQTYVASQNNKNYRNYDNNYYNYY